MHNPDPMMTPDGHDSPPGTEPPVEQKSRWEDYIDVFFSPVELFRRRENDRLAPPLITLLVLATAFYYILLPAQGIKFRATMAAAMPAGGMPEGMESMMGIMQIAGGLMQPVGYLVLVAMSAALLWLFTKLLGAKPSFRQMMLVATYAGFIALLGEIAGLIAIMMHGEAGLDIIRHTSFGPLRFVDTADVPRAVGALLGRFDIFAIWQAIIWGIGIYVVTGLSKGKSALAAAGVWFIVAVPGMFFGGPEAAANGNAASMTVEIG